MVSSAQLNFETVISALGLLKCIDVVFDNALTKFKRFIPMAHEVANLQLHVLI